MRAVTPGAALTSLALLACQGPGPADPAAAALAPWPDDPDALVAFCPTQPFAELVTTCRVQAAAKLAGAARGEDAGAVCAQIETGTWREECHFRVGEELAVAGQAAAAAAWCGRAGWFARRCVTHAAWRRVAPPGLDSTATQDQLTADATELLSAIEAGLAAHADPGVAGEGRDAFKAAWGHSVYLATGVADPAAARRADELGPALRTGWATEAVRLSSVDGLPEDLVSTLLAAWRDGRVIEGRDLRGTAQQPPPPRYAPLQLGAHDQGLPHLPLYGGGLRLVGADIDEDMHIALLEALYGHADAAPQAFLQWVDDDRQRVAWTAARLAALACRDAGSEACDAAAEGLNDPVSRRLLSGTVQ